MELNKEEMSFVFAVLEDCDSWFISDDLEMYWESQVIIAVSCVPDAVLSFK